MKSWRTILVFQIVSILLLAGMSMVDIAQAQVAAYKQRHRWLVTLEPSCGLFVGYTGFDNYMGNDISDFLRWGLGLHVVANYEATAYAVSSELRTEYQQSHSSGKYPQKGPSLMEFNLRPLYKLMRSSNYSLNLSLQGGIRTALLPEENTEGDEIRAFFDPAAIYEGLFLHQDYGYREESEIRLSCQLGYAFQQLVQRSNRDQYNRTSEVPTSIQSVNPGTSSSWGNGPGAILSIEYAPNPTRDVRGNSIVSFSASLSIIALNKATTLLNWQDSRVESSFRASLTIFEYIDFVSSIGLIYDSSISERRELISNFSINLRYNLDLSSGY